MMKQGFLLFLLCVALAVPAKAQVANTADVKQIPVYQGLSDADFEAKTEVRHEKPAGDRYLEYQVRLPKGWKKAGEDDAPAQSEKKEILTQRILGKVAKYQSPPSMDEPSRFEVSASELDYEVSARNWFLNHILTSGYTLQGLNEVSEHRIEALYVQVENGTTYIVRTVAEINGPRIVLASYYLPDSQWNAQRAMQQHVVTSFKFLNPEQGRIETSRTYNFLDLFRFDYPASWKLLAPGIDQQDSIDIQIVNKTADQNLVGEISLHAVSTEKDTTLSQEVGVVRDMLKQRGFEIGDMIETVDNFKPDPQMTFSRVEAYKLVASNQKVHDYECWLAILAEDRFYYIMTLITSGRNSDFYRWARSTAALKQVAQTIRP